MYCKKCGTQIDDDSEFCKNCGTKQISEENSNTPIQPENKNKGMGCGSLILFTIITLLIAIIGFAIVPSCIQSCNDENKGYTQMGGGISNSGGSGNNTTTRDITGKDIEFTGKDLSTGSRITVIAKSKLRNLKLKIIFYDKNQNVIHETYEYIGNMEENEKYEFVMDTNFVNENILIQSETYNISVYDGYVTTD